MPYKVLDTRQITQITPGTGRSRQAYRVWIETGKGATGNIDVSPEDWNAEALTRILTEFADELDLPYMLTE
jgi:hypothetical protein